MEGHQPRLRSVAAQTHPPVHPLSGLISQTDVVLRQLLRKGCRRYRQMTRGKAEPQWHRLPSLVNLGVNHSGSSDARDKPRGTLALSKGNPAFQVIVPESLI